MEGTSESVTGILKNIHAWDPLTVSRNDENDGAMTMIRIRVTTTAAARATTASTFLTKKKPD